MVNPHDRNLILGILAVHQQHLTANQFLEACHRWLSEPDIQLPDAIIQCGFLNRKEMDSLENSADRFIINPDSLKFENNAPALSVLFSQVEDFQEQRDKYQVAPLFSSWHSIDDESDDTVPPNLGELADSYQFLRRLARGGLGKVSIANDPTLDREVAIKEVLPKYSGSANVLDRFINEARVAGRLEHPGVVPVYTMGQRNGQPFYVMRLIRGESLEEAIRELHGGKIKKNFRDLDITKLRRLIKCLGDACHTIAYAHSRNILHRDLKPANLMLGNYGETIVVDWGLAKSSSAGSSSGGSLNETAQAVQQDPSNLEAQECNLPHQTAEGAILGTPAFMSPEQANGSSKLDERSDIFSLGSCLYTIMANRAPFQASSSQEMLQLARESKVLRLRDTDPSIPKALQAIYLKAMKPAPDERYQNATELVEDLNRWIAGEATRACPENWTEKSQRWARSHQNIIAGTIGFLILSVFGLLLANRWISFERDAKNTALKQMVKLREAAEDASVQAIMEKNAAVQAREVADRHRSELFDVLDDFFLKVGNHEFLQLEGSEPVRLELIEYALDRVRKLDHQADNDPWIKSKRVATLGKANTLYRLNSRRDLAATVSDEQERELKKLRSTDPSVDKDYAGTIAGALTNIARSQCNRSGEKVAIAYGARCSKYVRKHQFDLTVDAYNLALVKSLLLEVQLALETGNRDRVESDLDQIDNVIRLLKYPEVPYIPACYRGIAAAQRVLFWQEAGRSQDAFDYGVQELEVLQNARQEFQSPIDILMIQADLQTCVAIVQHQLGHSQEAFESVSKMETDLSAELAARSHNAFLRNEYCDVLAAQGFLAIKTEHWEAAEESGRKLQLEISHDVKKSPLEIPELRRELLSLAIAAKVTEKKNAEFEFRTRLNELKASLSNINDRALDYRLAIEILESRTTTSANQ